MTPKAGGDQGLLPPHARAHQHQSLAIPVRVARDVIHRARVAEIHAQEIRRLALGVTNRCIAGPDTGGLIGWQVVRTHGKGEPALPRAIGDSVGPQGIYTRILKDHQRGEFTRLDRFREVAMYVRARAIELDC